MTTSDWLSISVASFALVVSLFTFWWSSMRRGLVRVATPLVYVASSHGPAGADSGARSDSAHLHVSFATVIHVTGVGAHVIRDLRLELADRASNTVTRLDWAGWDDDADGHGLKQPFVVAPGAPSERRLRFVQDDYAYQFDVPNSGALEARIAYVGNDETWKELGQFRLFRNLEAWKAGDPQVNSQSGESGSPYETPDG